MKKLKQIWQILTSKQEQQFDYFEILNRYQQKNLQYLQNMSTPYCNQEKKISLKKMYVEIIKN